MLFTRSSRSSDMSSANVGPHSAVFLNKSNQQEVFWKEYLLNMQAKSFRNTYEVILFVIVAGCVPPNLLKWTLMRLSSRTFAEILNTFWWFLGDKKKKAYLKDHLLMADLIMIHDCLHIEDNKLKILYCTTCLQGVLMNYLSPTSNWRGSPVLKILEIWPLQFMLTYIYVKYHIF